MVTTGAELKAVRVALGDSQAAFASRLGVDQSTVHRWEKEGPPKTGPARILLTQIVEHLRETAE